jgi:threonine dehydrogenase-like Zn-dependent dehydrogenase
VAVAPEPSGEAPLIFDTVGTAVTRRQAVEHLAPGGTAVLVGLHDDTCALPFYPLILGERRLQGAYTYCPDDFRRAVALVRDLPDSVADRRSLNTGPAVFAEMARGGVDRLKVLLEPPAEVPGSAVDGRADA